MIGGFIMDIVYKRILIINDDDAEEVFWRKYNNLQKYRDMIHYCNNSQDAFKRITSDDFAGFDKIILDIKIEWSIPEEYSKKIGEYIDLEVLKEVNMGFVIFMYLISRGYPIKRIAFLSAYIIEQDNEYNEKLELVEKIKKWKTRNEEQDQQIIKFVNKVPSLQKKVIRIIESEKYKGIMAYKEICRIIYDDTGGVESINSAYDDHEIKNNEQFFQLLRKTGIKIEEKQKVNKNDIDKLKEWIETEKDEQHGQFYELRYEMLNICENVKNSTLYIYELYNQRNKGVFKENYPKSYFENLISKVQYEISMLRENTNIEIVIGNVINGIVEFWESLDKKYIGIEPSGEDINNYAITMVLKNTRNWCTHGRVKKLDIIFCKFIFLLSIRLIYGRNKDVEDYIRNLHTLENYKISNDVIKYKKIWREINDIIIEKTVLKTNTYTLNLVDLYYKYSNEKVRNEIELESNDLINMFILCLHYPYIKSLEDDKFEIGFHEINYEKQEPYMVFLEKIALNILSN